MPQLHFYTGGTIMVMINGISIDAAGQSVSQYLATTACNPQRLVIEYNGEILPRESYDSTILSDDDHVEIISFMGGG